MRRCFMMLMLFGSALLMGENQSIKNGMELKISMSGDLLNITMTNRGQPVKVCSHINTQDLDWYTIILKKDDGKKRKLRVGEPMRTGSEMHLEELKPGAGFTHKIDLKKWALQEINRKKVIEPGDYTITVRYYADRCFYPSTDTWDGELISNDIRWGVK